MFPLWFGCSYYTRCQSHRLPQSPSCSVVTTLVKDSTRVKFFRWLGLIWGWLETCETDIGTVPKWLDSKRFGGRRLDLDSRISERLLRLGGLCDSTWHLDLVTWSQHCLHVPEFGTSTGSCYLVAPDSRDHSIPLIWITLPSLVIKPCECSVSNPSTALLWS